MADPRLVLPRHCARPPAGWVCYRRVGHPGPCPTYVRWWNLPARLLHRAPRPTRVARRG